MAAPPPDPPAKKAAETFGQRTSIYRGVTRHRWTGRYEAHLWDNSCRREGQSRKGRNKTAGGYDKEDKAARAYDLAALKYWGPTTTTNIPVSNYKKELEEMKHMTRQEFVASLRRRSSGFSRGASIYRGVTRHHQHGRWQARIGRVAGNKDLYLGTFSKSIYIILLIPHFRVLNSLKSNLFLFKYKKNKIKE
nr:AP2-like ethylene-responsive transcription factor AIL5 isoform X1 [Ipomoea batatas]